MALFNQFIYASHCRYEAMLRSRQFSGPTPVILMLVNTTGTVGNSDFGTAFIQTPNDSVSMCRTKRLST